MNDGGPAFPRDGLDDGENEARAQSGMSLRDWFAGQAVAGLVQYAGPVRLKHDEMANAAYEIADAMLAAREAK